MRSKCFSWCPPEFLLYIYTQNACKVLFSSPLPFFFFYTKGYTLYMLCCTWFIFHTTVYPEDLSVSVHGGSPCCLLQRLTV